MRVLRLPVDGRRIVDLHPALSVVTGLEPDRAAVLRRAVAAIASGLAPDGGGVLEAHGLLLDATQADVDLLGTGKDPSDAVLGAASLRDPAGDEGHEQLAAAERDVLLLARDRRWAALAAVAAERQAAPGRRDLARAEHLRLAIALHDGTDVEPLRRALDLDRDARRGGGDDPATKAAIVDALLPLGIDLRDGDVAAQEIRRVADDLLDEHRRHAAWVVGARVELDGVERRAREALAVPAAPPPSVATLPESAQRRAERATAAHADALARADELREALRGAGGSLPARDLEWALLRRVTDRRRDHLAGTVPLLLDRLLTGLDADEVRHLLDRLAPLARGVQLVVLDDHPAAAVWADEAGLGRAAVVTAVPETAGWGSPTMRPTTT